MVRYLVLRTLIFCGCLALAWLVGLRDQSQQLLAVVIAAVASMAISAVVLRPFRQQASEQIARRVEVRAQRKGAQALDEEAEDADVAERQARMPRAQGDADSEFR